MGKTKAELTRWKTQLREDAAARKKAVTPTTTAIASPSSSGEGGPPPTKRAKTTTSSHRPRKHNHHQQDDKLLKAFFPIGQPLEGDDDEEGEQNGERELDEAEKYILSVREEEKKLPSFVTVSNPYVLPEMASSYIGGGGSGSGGGKHDVVYVARPSAAQPSFAPSGAAPSPDEIAARHLRPPHSMMPTRLWRQRFLANFIQLRANLKHPSTLPSPANPGFSTSVNPPAHYVPVPGPGEREKWRQYIVGAARKKVKVNKKVDPVQAAAMEKVEERPSAGVQQDAGPSSGPLPARPPPTAAAASSTVDVDDEEMELAAAAEQPTAGPSRPSATTTSTLPAPPLLWPASDDDEEEGGYAFTDPTIEDGTEWYGADDDFGEEEEPPFVGGGEEEEEMMNDSSESSSDEEDEDEAEDEWEWEPEQPKHREKEPSLTLIQSLPETTLLPLLAHLTHYLLPSPTLLSTHRTHHLPSNPSDPNPPPTPSPYPTLTPLYARWILSLLSVLPSYISPKGTTQLRDLARVCLEVLESYVVAGGRRDKEVGEGEEERMSCWMVFGIVVEVWAQRDLVLDAEVVFGSF